MFLIANVADCLVQISSKTPDPRPRWRIFRNLVLKSARDCPSTESQEHHHPSPDLAKSAPDANFGTLDEELIVVRAEPASYTGRASEMLRYYGSHDIKLTLNSAPRLHACLMGVSVSGRVFLWVMKRCVIVNRSQRTHDITEDRKTEHQNLMSSVCQIAFLSSNINLLVNMLKSF